jgi:DNA-binding LytR/AlgR family response regulator
MTPAAPTALIADDEPLLRERLAAHLERLWPELVIVGQARNGREALELFERHAPQIAFLDVHMPAPNGIEVAEVLQGRAHVVFVTAFDRYAVQAFEQGAVDYLVKPFDEARLGACVARLRERLAQASSASAAPPAPDWRQLTILLREQFKPRLPLQWIKASVGQALKLIPVEEVAYLKADEKYTLVAWSGGEALIRKPIRELADELDGEVFVQVHRSVIVNLKHVAQIVRGPNETADVHLRGRPEVLPVSRSYLAQFRQM